MAMERLDLHSIDLDVARFDWPDLPGIVRRKNRLACSRPVIVGQAKKGKT
jgi:hypothetical protein